jgi:hypothetical protein
MLDDVNLEDTWVLGWRHGDDRFVIEVQASLLPEHPCWGSPKPGEWACYRRGRLVFEGVRAVAGLLDQENPIPPYSDATGERDFGSIDALQSVDGGYRVRFNSVDVQLQCGGVRLELDPA